MEGTPPTVLHLLHYAETLSDSELFRHAALVYAACATSPAISPLVKTRLLYNAAHHLYLHIFNNPTSPTSPRDQSRALEFLSKCSLLLNSLPHSSQLVFNVTALTVSLQLHVGDYHAAQKTVRRGLEQASGTKGHLHWWAFFQAHLIFTQLNLENHSIHGLHTAAAIATDAALEMRRHSFHVGACAFALARAQYLLAAPCPDYPGAEAGLKAALQSLKMPHVDQSEADIRFLDLIRCLLKGILIVRRGDFRDEHVVKRVKSSYNYVSKAQKTEDTVGWQWATPRVIIALTRHVVAIAGHTTREGGGEASAAELAVREIGIVPGDGNMIIDKFVREPEVPEAAQQAILVSVIESLVREKMTALEFGQIKGYIGKMAEEVFPDRKQRRLLAKVEAGEDTELIGLLRGNMGPTELRLKSCVLLLIAEYHNLLGKVVEAQIAGKFLSAVLSTAGESGTRLGESFVSDAWQKALSLQLMLTGDPRPLPLVQTICIDEKQAAKYRARGMDVRFGNIRCLALAWFTCGVYQMRRGDVLEAREAITCVLELLEPSSNPLDQILSNAKAVASGLGTRSGQTDDHEERLIKDAIASATALGDLVTLSRALRQVKKLEHRKRIAVNPALRSQIDVDADGTQDRCRSCFLELKQKQRKASPQLFDESTLGPGT